MNTPLVSLLVDASERALDRALGALAVAGYDGLSPSHALAIQLVETGVGTTRDLAIAMRMTPQAVSTIVAQLETRGFVIRRRQEHDARAKDITLTEEGRQLAAAIARSLLAVERDWVEAVGRDQAEVVREALASYVVAGVAGRPEEDRPRRRRIRVS